VNFQADGLGVFQRLSKQLSDVFQVIQHRYRILLSFAAVGFVVVKAETVIKAFRFFFRLFDNPLADLSESIELALMNPVKREEFYNSCH
jgi:hypothetical protein